MEFQWDWKSSKSGQRIKINQIINSFRLNKWNVYGNIFDSPGAQLWTEKLYTSTSPSVAKILEPKL